MHLFLDKNLAANYQSPSQVARVLTESWLQQNIYCPSCGNEAIESFQNNQPVADFFCSQCHEEYELKSKQGTSIGNKVADGAYHTMLERIAAKNNPSFFFLCYRKTDLAVQHLIVIPKHFFTPNIIMPRAKGLPTRPNYIMCSMDINQLPTSGKISLVTNGNIVAKDTVIDQWQQHLFLRQTTAKQKGWLLAIMQCVEKLPNPNFTLKDIYVYAPILAKQFPSNQHIHAKIRQQLQILRDKHIIEFLGNGNYRKIPS